ncbi:rhodanese domain-containing protein [Chloropicon primus]|uniref:Rhodanese domain-containing protein n=1 Tax=Chloropicon primus TaxID=1764295 RepID=A0A5B8MST3_9CHLO|nr:hypothetical protein A3770_10p58650 [Chloropicon primus]UPR02559.1 rhodanese domain-containing protein [Chloropicon primus]|eukprot:QDZ23347.1 hypothetical protein A3770_10p58650 [Chloropicon primus]
MELQHGRTKVEVGMGKRKTAQMEKRGYQRKALTTGTVYCMSGGQNGGAGHGVGDGPVYCVMNFYHLVDVENKEEELKAHEGFLSEEKLDIKGRVFISEHGVNAQLSGPEKDAVQYAEWIKTRPKFSDLHYRTFPCPGHAFPKLIVRNKALVSLLREMDTLPVTEPEKRAEKVSPKRWKAMLEEVGGDEAAEGKDKKGTMKPLLIDVRNDYEWDTGHFAGAERPEEYNFIETPVGKEVYNGLEEVDRERPIMMYCTGGIRCDIYSTVMRKQGFKNLYTLEGGIQNYLREEGEEHWKGSLYVFDSRMAVPPHLDSTKNDGYLPAVSPCAICGATAEAPHLNCANVDCNKLFLACEECKPKYYGCCCEKCTQAPRLLRPIKKDGYYAKLHTYKETDEELQRQKRDREALEEKIRRKKEAAAKAAAEGIILPAKRKSKKYLKQ